MVTKWQNEYERWFQIMCFLCPLFNFASPVHYWPTPRREGGGWGCDLACNINHSICVIPLFVVLDVCRGRKKVLDKGPKPLSWMDPASWSNGVLYRIILRKNCAVLSFVLWNLYPVSVLSWFLKESGKPAMVLNPPPHTHTHTHTHTHNHLGGPEVEMIPLQSLIVPSIFT